LDGVNGLSHKQIRHFGGRGKDAIASSDTTKASFVKMIKLENKGAKEIRRR